MLGENATPPRRDALRRSVLNFSTPLRKSTAASATPSMEPHDEEKERSGRRSMVVLLKRLSSIPSPSVETGHLLSEREIQDQLRICTKLYSENRISSRNAWELHIIDAIRKIVSQNQANLMQVAGSSLDVGSKIYSLRIDDAHNKAIQLASNVGKSDRKQAQAAEDDNVTENPREKRRQVRKKVLKILADKKTIIDEEGKSLFGPIKPMESVVFATKENIEVSAIDNLLTSKVPVNPASHKFMLLSNEKYWTTKPDDILKYQDQVVDNDLPPVSSFDLCVRFKNFEIGTWSPEDEANLLEETFNTVPPAALDENGVPIPELDGSIPDIFADNDDAPMDVDPTSDTEQQEVFQMQLHDGINHIADAVPQEYRIETDYGYNALVRGQSGMYFDKIWAGPCHWKVKFIKKSTARYSGSTVQQVVKQTRKKNEPEPINFLEPFFDTTKSLKKFVIKRRPGTTDFEKVTYPVLDWWVDGFLKKKNFFSLKPNTLFAKPNTTEKNPDFEVPIYNYENPNDSLYCSLPNTDDANDGASDHSFEEDMPPVEQQQFLEGNLVDAPEIVSVNHVTYAMHAKKIDMKKLKTCIWKHLTGGQQETVKPTRFSTVYEQIPVLAPEMSKNLSPHLGILSLLHLCNDHNLCLKPIDHQGDFIVMDAQN
ncbi:Condensin complex subunit 2-like Protein [Tribolium castaneum]|uniref:Condensin complex subunit 2 n=2 Tax=Tribolium castaneum TaxID=7070 RepID=D6WGJ7_TRICA|nr:Condensin complex subunit 2-like Protein [Tribolium castaneum]